jgi:dipeptidyl aminopeptidase/acylaminoacyl peptidase
LGNESLFRVLASGRHSPARLAYVLPNADAPIISPVRSRLAYVRGTLNENLWRLDTRTGERKMLGAADGTSNHPQYSPDGRKIAFQSNRSGEWGVWTCNADGSNCMQLNSFGNAFGGTPHWSPDSQWIAFDSRTEGHAQVYVMQADGVGQRRITNDAAEDIAPSFSNDGRWIYFASDRSGSMETWKMPATGGPGVQVTRAGGGPGLESADGKYIYYSKGVAAPLYRMPVKGGAEVQVLPRVEAWCDATWCDTAWCDFAIVRKGIYFTPDGKTIQRQVLSSGNVSTLATVEKGLRGGLCVSPDEAFVVWSQHDHASVELMLVEGFR